MVLVGGSPIMTTIALLALSVPIRASDPSEDTGLEITQEELEQLLRATSSEEDEEILYDKKGNRRTITDCETGIFRKYQIRYLRRWFCDATETILVCPPCL